MPPDTGYRIEHWRYDDFVLLAEGVAGEDPETILAPYVNQLRGQGAGGVVVVVSQATGVVVARRAFWSTAAPVSPGRRSVPEQAPGS